MKYIFQYRESVLIIRGKLINLHKTRRTFSRKFIFEKEKYLQYFRLILCGGFFITSLYFAPQFIITPYNELI